jgi:CCT motif
VDIDSYVPRSLLHMESTMRAQVLQDRREKVSRFREKKKNRLFKKTIRYASRKAYAEVRPRIKGRFARKDEVVAMRAAGLLPAACA